MDEPRKCYAASGWLSRQSVRLLISGFIVKCTKKVRIIGKYGTHYGPSLRKMVRIEMGQCAKYICSLCGKTKRKRQAVRIWYCGSYMKRAASGAWTYHYNTTPAVTVKCAIRRLKELKDQ
ncbi:60S ribosomal protein L37a-like [Enhydra lutris kenyoni]|uniref:60S ribosomal protein L37a-like n=1 Tax=Enhydra lutris kenyoni TaxID=391180 RepID=A0A2Y9IXS0_ENHLU|nr:60S ribosomal protein L37a-like [Enhydra lutris kenyoni]